MYTHTHTHIYIYTYMQQAAQNARSLQFAIKQPPGNLVSVCLSIGSP